MTIIQQFVRAKQNFANERGSFSVEAVLMFPLLIWAFIAMFVFFEGLRESNINLKATYTVSDLLSRETELIDQDYLDGMNEVYAWLSRSPNDVALRVTVVRYDADSDSHIKIGSGGVDRDELTQLQVDAWISPHVPIMADASTAIVVETWTTFTPILDIGLTETDIYNVIVTAPRFDGQLTFAGYGDGGGTTHNDGSGDDQDESF